MCIDYVCLCFHACSAVSKFIDLRDLINNRQTAAKWKTRSRSNGERETERTQTHIHTYKHRSENASNKIKPNYLKAKKIMYA